WIREISETREHVEDIVERVVAERLSHVLPKKTKVRTLSPLRPVDALGREIEAGHVEAQLSQISGMAPTATPEIEYRRVAGRLEPGNQSADEGVGLVLVTMSINLVIVLAVEPRREPFRLRLKSASGSCFHAPPFPRGVSRLVNSP